MMLMRHYEENLRSSYYSKLFESVNEGFNRLDFD